MRHLKVIDGGGSDADRADDIREVLNEHVIELVAEIGLALDEQRFERVKSFAEDLKGAAVWIVERSAEGSSPPKAS